MDTVILTVVKADTKLSYQNDNGKSYEYVFIPADTASYETVGSSIQITVNKAQNPPQVPDSVMNVGFSCKKVGDVTLPDGWEWTPKQGQDTKLTVGNTITVKATYTAADSVNYENLTVDVAITRSSCEHAKTERRGESKATCAATGNNNPVPVNPVNSNGPQYGVKAPGLNNVQKNVKQLADNAKKPKQDDTAAEDAKEPFIRGEDGKEGWDVIQAETAASAEGSTIAVKRKEK